MGKFMWLLPDEAVLLLFGFICGMPIGCGLTMIYWIKRGFLK